MTAVKSVKIPGGDAALPAALSVRHAAGKALFKPITESSATGRQGVAQPFNGLCQRLFSFLPFYPVPTGGVV
ncbi:hypothetical protein M5585_11975 [Serratia ureilytica]